MRSAALIFGLLAGLLGCGVIAFSNLETGLSAVTALGPHRELIAKFGLYLIPNIGFLGAGLALAKPRLAGLFMLLSAAAWAAAAFVAGHGAVLFAALPFTFVAAGGLVALFARRDQPGFDTDDNGPDSRPRWAVEPPPADDDRQSYAPQGQGPGRRRQAPPLARQYDDEPDDHQADDDQQDYGRHNDDHQRYEQAEPEDFDNRPRPGNRSPAPQRRTMPEAPLLPEQRDEYFPERQPRPPSLSQQVAAGDFELSPDDFPPPQRRNFEPTRRNPYQEFEPYDPDQEPPRRVGALRTIVRVVNFLLFVGLIGGAAAAVYFDYQRGANSLLFGNHQSNTSQVVQPSQKPAIAPATVPPTPAKPASSNNTSDAAPASPDAAAPSDPATDASAGNRPVPLASPQDASTAAATPPAATATADTNSTVFNDPVKYCATVDTVDAPDGRFTGAAIPSGVASALQLPASADASKVHWRCAGKIAYACYATTIAVCSLTPTVELMVAYCAAHPDTQSIPAPNGFWNCNGKRPVIPRDQKWPADARGFYAPAWTRLADAANG